MKRRYGFIDDSGSEGMSIVQGDVVVGDEVQFPETWNRRTLERKRSQVVGPFGEIRSREGIAI